MINRVMLRGELTDNGKNRGADIRQFRAGGDRSTKNIKIVVYVLSVSPVIFQQGPWEA
jgi:hypothetical protein